MLNYQRVPGVGMTISYYTPINFTVTTFKYVEDGPDREAQEVVYLNLVTLFLNELDSGRAKENLPGGSLKYLFIFFWNPYI